MHVRREGFIVKIRSAASGAPVGLGFVVGARHIVTCAHVINAALGRDKYQTERPLDDVRVQVEFALLGDVDGAPLRACRVAAWDPPGGRGDSGRDVAGLFIVGGDTLPVGAGPARLLDAHEGTAADADVSVFGFPGTPNRKEKGAWTSCSIRGTVGGGLIQLDSRAEAALRAQPGYSGSPVVAVDRWGDAAVGMLVIASKGGAAHDAYALPLSEVAAVWPDVLGRSVLPPCPYRGLQPFTAADAQAGVFVGREREVERLRGMVKRQPLVVVTGPSGVGKSSLVAAGLQPALSADGWVVAPFRPGVTPYESVARALLDLERPGASHSLEQLDHRAQALRRDGFWHVASKIALLTGKRLALIGDQFEEVFSAAPDAEKALEFLRQLLPLPGTVPDPRVRLVCTLRADFLPDLLALPDVGPRLQDRQLNVSPLDEAALTRVIVEPAQLAGVVFSSGLPESIAAEAGRASGSLPLLEFTLTELWPLQRQRQISFDSYHGLGGVSGALNQHAENAYHWLRNQIPLGEQRIRRTLLSMIRARGGSSSAVRFTADRAHLGKDWDVAQLLAEPDRRLVILGSDGPQTAEIAHEAIIREWSRLAAWVEEDADFQQWLAVMEERARDGDLLSDTRVAEAQRWLGERGPDIPHEVADLIELSNTVILEQQKTRHLLSQTQEVTEQLLERSAELEVRQRHLQRSNIELEEKAEILAQQNHDIEVKNAEIEEARQVLQERAEWLALSIRFKSEFIANMSHELRTPLNSLLILAKLLAENSDSTLSSKQVDFAETIHAAGLDVLQLVEDTLDLSMAESGTMGVKTTGALISQLARDLEATFRPLAEMKELEFTVRIEPETPPTLRTDEHRLRQAVHHLLSNAVKFTDAGSVSLVIGPADEDVPQAVQERFSYFGSPFDSTAGLIAFTVTDTGIGITEAEQRVIFGAFKQGGDGIKQTYGGTGLGLSLSQEIVRLLGGEIHVRSTPGHGSTFTALLPLGPGDTPPRSLPPAAAHEELPALLGKRNHQDTDSVRRDGTWRRPALHSRSNTRFGGELVLIVGDDIRHTFTVTSVLERHGLNVLHADDGREVVQVLEQHDVAVVLIDVTTREADGYAAVAAIRATPRRAGLPLIVSIATATEGYLEKALDSGASDCMVKSVNPDVLLPMLRRWLTGSVDQDPSDPSERG